MCWNIFSRKSKSSFTYDERLAESLRIYQYNKKMDQIALNTRDVVNSIIEEAIDIAKSNDVDKHHVIRLFPLKDEEIKLLKSYGFIPENRDVIHQGQKLDGSIIIW